MATTTSANSVQITNQLNIAIIVYDTTSTVAPTDPPSTNQADYYPVYTQIATVPANSTQTVPVSETLARLVLTRADNDFPICVYVPPIMGGGSVQIATQDLAACETGWSFYQAYVSQPYAPVSLQFTELLLNNPNPLTLDDQVSAFLAQNGYAGCDYIDFSIVSYWATNSLYAWPNTYYCYEPSNNTSGFVMPTSPVGQIVIANGNANFTPANGGSSLALAFSDSVLSSKGASSSSGLYLTGVLRSLSWEGQPSQLAMCFSGKYNGTDFIAQPYQNPSLPWWAAAYDMAFATFLSVQVVMTLDMAAHVLTGVKNGIQYLAGKISDFVTSVRGQFEELGADADPVASMGDPVDPINVDVDVDVDVDIDTDTDTDENTDVDVD